MYNVTLEHVHTTIVAVEKQYYIIYMFISLTYELQVIAVQKISTIKKDILPFNFMMSSKVSTNAVS
jgi:hypothetical protein